MNEDHSFALKPEQLEFLNEMARKYTLPDASKALRCLINYAKSDAGKEQEIFQTIRCTDC